jgi:hypothetical protein
MELYFFDRKRDGWRLAVFDWRELWAIWAVRHYFVDQRDSNL